MYWLILITLAIAVLPLTGLLIRHARASGMMDFPNERSSHEQPTPRGGGVAIVLLMLASMPFLWKLGYISGNDFLALFGSGLLVAFVGWLDDRSHVAVRWRVLFHFIAAVWALVLIGGIPPLQFYGSLYHIGWIGNFLAAVFLVWMLNLYNFMDGINGIASIEAVTVCLSAVVLFSLYPGAQEAWRLPLLLAVVALGFLFWNFPSARVFMGDAGSGFIGIMLGLFSIQAAWIADELFWSWIILLGAFVVDATFTLLRRMLRGEQFHEAHRSHAYQHAARRYGSHVPVALAVGGINLLWLLPVATLVTLGWVSGVAGVLVAYTPLLALAYWLDAGRK